jgi:small subunit ribosomal protein S16
LVVAESTAPRDGAFLEILGQYNPLTDPATVTIDEDKTLSWLRKGARPSETAAKLLQKQGVLGKVKSGEA